MTAPLLTIDDLSVRFGRRAPYSEVVHGVGLTVGAGEKVALVGESGSGKTVTAYSVLRLHEQALVSYPTGSIRFDGRDLLTLEERELRRVRGRDIAMIFQEPMSALNPVYTIGDQLMEPLLLHEGLSRKAARERMIELLDRTGIAEPHKRFDAFPHMLSGGQRQRVMIAMALACRPRLLIADEPTTALDVTVQIQILDLLEELQREFSLAVLLITHDLAMVRRFADRVYVMEQGRMVEQAAVAELFARPQHPYTRRLLDAQPERMAAEEGRAAGAPLFEGEGLRCRFPIRAGLLRRRVGEVKAVDGVDLALHPGETLGVVGESGSGKSTLGLCLLRLQECDGAIRFDGRRLDALPQRRLRPLRRDFQVVFQDPFASLSPRMTVEGIVGEGLAVHFPKMTKGERRERIVKVLEEVGLGGDELLGRYPHEFSGGQRQRIAIARAVILEPKVVLLDEPTSALDVSVQKQVLELLRRLQRDRHMSYLFITHDLKVIRAMAHRVMVMRGGRVVEAAETEQLFAAPREAYTRNLLRAALLEREGAAPPDPPAPLC